MPERHTHGDFIERFTPGLLDPQSPTPDSVTGHSGKGADKRFNVYRNNVTASLVSAVGHVYPLTRKALGEEAFHAAALTFVRDHPPTSKLLFQYGYGFDRHLDASNFTGGRSWISAVAALERAWLDAYHAADADPLAAEALGQIPPEKLGEAVFRAHPATRILPANVPAVSILIELKAGRDPSSVLDRPAEIALVTRPALAVDLRALEGATATFFQTLVDGSPLGEAAGVATDAGPFDLGAALGAVLETGAFTSIDIT